VRNPTHKTRHLPYCTRAQQHSKQHSNMYAFIIGMAINDNDLGTTDTFVLHFCQVSKRACLPYHPIIAHEHTRSHAHGLRRRSTAALGQGLRG
jgi:hypothetical protein